MANVFLERYLRPGLTVAIPKIEGANKIQKRTFIDLYDAARVRAFTMNNIDAGWRGTGLYPFYPETVLSH